MRIVLISIMLNFAWSIDLNKVILNLDNTSNNTIQLSITQDQLATILDSTGVKDSCVPKNTCEILRYNNGNLILSFSKDKLSEYMIYTTEDRTITDDDFSTIYSFKNNKNFSLNGSKMTPEYIEYQRWGRGSLFKGQVQFEGEFLNHQSVIHINEYLKLSQPICVDPYSNALDFLFMRDGFGVNIMTSLDSLVNGFGVYNSNEFKETVQGCLSKIKRLDSLVQADSLARLDSIANIDPVQAKKDSIAIEEDVNNFLSSLSKVINTNYNQKIPLDSIHKAAHSQYQTCLSTEPLEKCNSLIALPCLINNDKNQCDELLKYHRGMNQ